MFIKQPWNKRFFDAATDGGSGGGAPAAGGQPAAGGAPAAGSNPVWTESVLQDPDLREFAINKGYHKEDLNAAAPKILSQYRNLEKLFGADKAGRTVELPNFEAEDDQAVAARNAFYEKLGRPKEGKDYDLAIPQGAKAAEFMDKWSRETFHKLGITSRQATELSKSYQALEAAQAAEAAQADIQRFAEEDKALKTEWGAAYADKMAKASAAARGLGIKGEVIDALQSKAGYSDVMKMFAHISEKIGEDAFISGDKTNTGNKLTPDEANAELNRLSRDKEFMASWMDKSHPNHAAAVARKSFLTSQLAASQVA